MRSGFLIRVVAYFIDQLIAFILVTAAIFVLVVWAPEMLMPKAVDLKSQLNLVRYNPVVASRMSILLVSVGLVYYSTEVFFGTTIGKLICGMKIRDMDGYRCSVWMLTIRYAAKHCDKILAVLGMMYYMPLVFAGAIGGLAIEVGYLFALGSDRRTLHDYIGMTAVYPTGYDPESRMSSELPPSLSISVPPRERKNSPDPNDLLKSRW